MTYLIKPPRTRGLSQLHTADALTVRLADIHRVKSSHYVEGFGTMREVESVGKDDGTLEIGSRDALAANGSKSGRLNYRVKVKRRASDLHAVVRRMSDADVEAVAALDAEIEAIRLQLRDARERRAQAVQASWRRGREVPLREVVALLP